MHIPWRPPSSKPPHVFWENKPPGVLADSGDVAAQDHPQARVFQVAAIQQGWYSTCQTLTVMQSLDVIKDPAGKPMGAHYLKDMVTAHPDGSYTVNFPGYPNRPITVTAEDMQDRGLSIISKSAINNLKNNALHLKAMEKAALHIHYEDNSVVDPYRLLLGQEATVYGFPADHFTGKFAKELLKNGRGGNELVITAHLLGAQKYLTDLHGLPHTLPRGHAYSISVSGGDTAHPKYFIENPADTTERFPVTANQIAQTFSHIYVAGARGQELSVSNKVKDMATASAELGKANFAKQAASGRYSHTRAAQAVQTEKYDMARAEAGRAEANFLNIANEEKSLKQNYNEALKYPSNPKKLPQAREAQKKPGSGIDNETTDDPWTARKSSILETPRI